jgi:hypothetical protein
MKFSQRLASMAGIFFFALTVSAQVRADSTVLILRHGEKPPLGLGQLTCRGLNRSLALAPLLLARYGTPVAVYASNPSKLKVDSGVEYAYIRPLATIEPLAIRVGIPVNLEWGMTEIAPLAARILASAPGTQIVAWEHHWGESLARMLLSKLGGNPAAVPAWADDDFDSIYVIRSSAAADGARTSFSQERQGLDGLSDQCPG